MGVVDPEKKRKIIGKEFIGIFDEFAQQLENELGKRPAYLVQGTLYPDVIESCPPPGSGRNHFHTIKSHHNLGGLPKDMKLKLIEPLKLLFKDEVRELGKIMNVPEGFLKRHPFPGPGLAVRVIGDVTSGNRLETLRQADICQLGMDQRKVNVLAREYCDDIKRKNKPIILLHHMLPGLQQGQLKMSKSDASSAIFMEDEEEIVIAKIEKAYCPPKVVDGNPCLEYLKYVVFPQLKEFTVVRNAEDGVTRTYQSYEELVVDYEAETLHPDDVKLALSKGLNKILQPVRDHFSSGAPKDLLDRVKSYRVTR